MISNSRNKKKAQPASGKDWGTLNSPTHIPTISSITIFPGSGPQSPSRTFDAAIPARKKTIVSASAKEVLGVVNHQIRRASKLPTVPGASGKYPTPPPLPMMAYSVTRFLFKDIKEKTGPVAYLSVGRMAR